MGKLFGFILALALVIGALLAGSMLADGDMLREELARDGIVQVEGTWQEVGE